MSARGEGSWQQFRAAVEEFHVDSTSAGEDGENGDDIATSDLPVYQEVRLGLQTLAHVEFFSANATRDWRVVPPALAVVSQVDSYVGMMCGARSPQIYGLLKSIGNRLSYDVHQVPGMPDRIRMLGPELKDLHIAAGSMGFVIQENAPIALLAAIPPVDDARSWKLADPPTGVGWMIERFLPSNLRWTKINRTEVEEVQTDLVRFRMRYQRFHFLRWGGRTFRIHVQVGKYAVLKHAKKKRLLFYDAQSSLLTVPAICRPPLLIERALVLCSGLLPRFDRSSGRVEYMNVPPNVAKLAAQLLRQEI